MSQFPGRMIRWVRLGATFARRSTNWPKGGRLALKQTFGLLTDHKGLSNRSPPAGVGANVRQGFGRIGTRPLYDPRDDRLLISLLIGGFFAFVLILFLVIAVMGRGWLG